MKIETIADVRDLCTTDFCLLKSMVNKNNQERLDEIVAMRREADKKKKKRLDNIAVELQEYITMPVHGELRIKLGALVGFFPTEGVSIKSADIPIGGGLYARMKTAAGTNWLDVAVQISRHLEQSYEPTPWPTWPW